jgi:hypothetical protein
MCNKQQHHTEFDAKRQALALNRDKHISLNHRRVYECEKCGNYHVTRGSVAKYKRKRR